MGIRITTWNVNGIRNPFSYQPWRDKKSFVAMFDVLEADIVIFQETKIQRKDLKDDMVLIPGWDCYFSLPKHEKGKFGVVIYTRQSVCAPIRTEEGVTGILCPPNSATSFRDLTVQDQIGGYPTEAQAVGAAGAPDIAADFAMLDSEGRCVILEFPAFVLLGVYSPATRDDTRNAFRIAYLNLLDIRIRNLVAMGKRVILAGDLNVSKSALDIANAETEFRKRKMSEEEFLSRPSSRLFNHLLEDGEVWGERDEGREFPVLHDVCRSFHPTRKGMFTHWETKINARPGNYGSRIDYVLCSLDMKDWFVESNIQEGLMGSDHCPVYAILKDEVTVDGKLVATQDLMNPANMFRDRVRLREYSPNDILPLSGRLIPEFSGRRSIRDMFTTRVPTTISGSVGTGRLALLEQVPSVRDSGDLDDSSKNGNQQHPPSESQDIRSPLAGPDPAVSGLQIQSPGNKRVPSEPPNLQAIKKRRKDSMPAPKTVPSKGQMNLKGFFKPKAVSSPEKTGAGMFLVDIAEPISPAYTNASISTPNASSKMTISVTKSPKPTDPPKPSPPSGPPTPSSDHSSLASFPILDPIASKDSWSKLFTKPSAPRCEGHNEPCKTMTTKKPGVNCGRAFWMCSRPLGPSGEKEKATQWRCGTFIWCSDWGTGPGPDGNGGRD